MDAYGHVNNAVYVTYLEQARVALLFDQPDSSFAAGDSHGVIVASHEITYLKPVSYHPAPLRIELWVDRVGGASVRLGYEVFDAEALVARAATSLVTFDFATGAPRRLTDSERVFLARYADDEIGTT